MFLKYIQLKKVIWRFWPNKIVNLWTYYNISIILCEILRKFHADVHETTRNYSAISRNIFLAISRKICKMVTRFLDESIIYPSQNSTLHKIDFI